jgi:branched-chain amino acid transport system permease protein
VIAMIMASLAGVIIGLPTLRLRGDYIAIVTLGFGEIIRVTAINGQSIHLGGASLTNGAQGITPIDQIKLPFAVPFNQLNLRPWYWLGLAFVLIILFCNVRLRDSRLGRAWIAIREDEVAAVSMGIPLVKTKLLAYASGAACGGLAGAYLGALTNTVAGTEFQFSFSIFVLAMIILGGLGSIWGATVGAIVLSFINYYVIQKLSVPGFLHLHVQLADIAIGIFGFLLVFIMVIRPEGILPERRRKLELTEGLGTDDVFEVSA